MSASRRGEPCEVGGVAHTIGHCDYYHEDVELLELRAVDAARGELLWAVSTCGFGCPTVYDDGQMDAAFVAGWRLAMAQVQDVMENGWADRRHPREVLDDIAAHRWRIRRNQWLPAASVTRGRRRRSVGCTTHRAYPARAANCCGRSTATPSPAPRTAATTPKTSPTTPDTAHVKLPVAIHVAGR